MRSRPLFAGASSGAHSWCWTGFAKTWHGHSFPSQSTHSVDIARLKKSEKWLTKQVNMLMRLFKSDDKFSQMLSQLESQPEYGGGSGSGGCGDDKPGDYEDGGEDKEDKDDS
nr:hypothetical protein [Tanacetum cinerariifolium]